MTPQNSRHEHINSVSGEETTGAQPAKGQRMNTAEHTLEKREWRLRLTVGEVVHYTVLTADFAPSERLSEQHRRDPTGTDYTTADDQGVLA
jgi:hypothetical protein